MNHLKLREFTLSGQLEKALEAGKTASQVAQECGVPLHAVKEEISFREEWSFSATLAIAPIFQALSSNVIGNTSRRHSGNGAKKMGKRCPRALTSMS